VYLRKVKKPSIYILELVVNCIKKTQRKIKVLLLKLLRIKDNAHDIAWGFTIGLIINFVPTFGMGPIISPISARLLRGNSTAGFIGGVSIIWAFPILFYLNVVVGHLFLPVEVTELNEGLENTEEALAVSAEIGIAFLIGMVANLFIFGCISYFLTYTVIKKFRYKLLRAIYERWNLK
jgi:uncharacterized protein (DUF2062 family)